MEVDESIILEQDASVDCAKVCRWPLMPVTADTDSISKKFQCGCVGYNYGVVLYYYIFRLVLGGLC